jgi:large subunit ribosomal protein L27
MAHTKAQKATSGNRDSKSKRRGIKRFGGEEVMPGNVLVRQKGSRFKAGEGTMLSKDFTIIALREGVVGFKTRLGSQYICVWEKK